MQVGIIENYTMTLFIGNIVMYMILVCFAKNMHARGELCIDSRQYFPNWKRNNVKQNS